MTKMKLNDETREILYKKASKIPCRLYNALLETHSALYSRALWENNQFPVRTFEFFSEVYGGLAKHCQQIGLHDDAHDYNLFVRRTMRKLKKEER